VKDVFEFLETNDLEKDNGYCNGCWLIPLKFNQGCFDVLQLLKDKSDWILRMVQLTVARTHSLKLIYVIHVINSLKKAGIKISKMEVVFVVPEYLQNEFKLNFKKVTHNKNQIFKELAWDINHPDSYRVVGFRRIV